jgi:sugar lactone lactonase YvrE
MSSGDRFGNARVDLAEGWRADYAAPPSRLFGANGIGTGADGRIYIAQLAGSRLSALDPATGAIEHLATHGSDILGPDDIAFDDAGTMFVTEFTEGRVSMRAKNGAVRVLDGAVPGANPITFHDGHLIAGECRPDGRIMEIDRDGGAPRIIVDHVPMSNAFEVGPDGKLYFPVMGTNEIWRVNLDGSDCEVVVGDLGVPNSVKFDARGFIVSTQVASGQVLRIDVQGGTRELLAQYEPGIDNCTFVGDRLFVSHMSGAILEITRGGSDVLNPRGLLFPLGIAFAPDGGMYVADGAFAYVAEAGGPLTSAGMLMTPGYPGFHSGVASAGAGEWIVTTSIGELRAYRPAAGENDLLIDGFERLTGVACGNDGRIVFAEAGTGRVLSLTDGTVSVLAAGLSAPAGIAIGADGICYVSEGNRVAKIARGGVETVFDGLSLPEGLAIHGDTLFVVDVTARTLVACNIDGSNRRTIASDLPVGGLGGVRRTLGPPGGFGGPMVPFTALAARGDGTLFLGADGNGSVIAFHQHQERNA